MAKKPRRAPSGTGSNRSIFTLSLWEKARSGGFMRRWVAVLTVVLAGQAALHGQQKANTSAFADAGITASPAFSDKELGAAPTGNWLKNGGNLFNQNYSPLKQI